jgi:hypothetical protein
MNIKYIECGRWNGFKWLRIGSNGRLFEHGSETSGSIKAGNFLII